MLSKEQLEDALNCYQKDNCTGCTCLQKNNEFSCAKNENQILDTALELLKDNKRLKESIREMVCESCKKGSTTICVDLKTGHTCKNYREARINE